MKMVTKAYDDDVYLGTTDFDIRELDALKPEDWLRLIDEADPDTGYEMFKGPGGFRIVDTVNVTIREEPA
jgi:hypothetical protein